MNHQIDSALPSDHRLILASQSPRRRALLNQAGYRFEVMVPDDFAEATCAPSQDSPVQFVQQLAQAKARNVAAKLTSDAGRWIVLAADTVAEIDRQVLGKPLDREDAHRMLCKLNGRVHLVHTGICLRNQAQKEIVGFASTRLRMDKLEESQIQQYLDTEQWMGKAGAFGYQDGWDWLHVEQGEESNIVGLPLSLLRSLLQEF